MNPVIDTPGGTVQGLARPGGVPGVRAFLGIPYGAPVGGRARFAAPEPARPWGGVRECDRPGPAAPQPLAGPLGDTVPGMALPAPPGDDCLRVNVWAPEGAAGLPVLVWVHGGSFRTGAAHLPVYDGARLAAEQQVVVVSAAYRLGALGFAALPGAPANRGLLDLVLALEWVRDAAGAFGGDAERVTLFGESAGGGAIAHLLAMPRAAGLFRRAVIQSGATRLTLDAATAAAVAGRLVAAAGGPGVALDGIPAERLVEAQEAAALELLAGVGAMPFHPWVDGEVVVAPPAAAVAGGSADGVDLVVGTTLDEMRLFLDPRDEGLDRERLVRRIGRYLAARGGPDAAAVAPDVAGVHLRGDRTPGDAWSAVQTFGEMRSPAWRLAEAHAARPGTATFAYLFTWPAAAHGGRLGACHGVDIPFPFGTLDRDGWEDFLGVGEDTWRLSEAVRRSWASFAGGGVPACDPIGPWPAFDGARRATAVLGREVGTADDPEADERAVWDRALP